LYERQPKKYSETVIYGIPEKMLLQKEEREEFD
jgi:hypothetical protein